MMVSGITEARKYPRFSNRFATKSRLKSTFTELNSTGGSPHFFNNLFNPLLDLPAMLYSHNFGRKPRMEEFGLGRSSPVRSSSSDFRSFFLMSLSSTFPPRYR